MVLLSIVKKTKNQKKCFF